MYNVYIKKYMFGIIKIKKAINFKKIYLFGIQIYSKKNLNIYYEEEKFMYSIYIYSGLTPLLNQRLDYIFSSPKYSLKYGKKTWLMYLHSLIERKEDEKAKVFLNKYIITYGKDGIEKSIVVAHFAKENGVINDFISKSAQIFECIEKQSIENYFAGKTIAVVGNSGCELNKNKGAEIDAHDIVIRFSNYPEDKKYMPDYGTKTSIWVKNLSPDAKQKENSNRFERVLQHGGLFHRIIDSYSYKFILKTFAEVGDKYINIPEEYYYELNEKYMIYRPTAGCAVIYFLYKLLGSLKNVDVYGFSFLTKDYSDTKHYFDKLCKVDINHDMKLEIDLLHKLYFEEKEK